MKRLAALLSLAVISLAAWVADPPGRVARLSLVEGETAVFVDPEAGWEGARINASLTSEKLGLDRARPARRDPASGPPPCGSARPRSSTSFAWTTRTSTRT